MSAARPIRVWRFEDANPQLRALSEHGGDEDWLVEVPSEYASYIGWDWLDKIDACLTPSIHEHPFIPGWKVLIGAHA